MPADNVLHSSQTSPPPERRARIDRDRTTWSKAAERTRDQRTASVPLVSLRDMIPSFMALSAAVNTILESKITVTWMRLASGLMAQAVIEQYLIYGNRNANIITNVFAWDFDPEKVAEEGSDEWMINAMFWDEEAESNNWHAIKNEYIRAVSHVFQAIAIH